MEMMRQEVAQLEATKQELEQRFSSLRLTNKNVPTDTTDLATPRLPDKYLHVLRQLERLRQSNRAMALEVLQRDLFRSAVQNLLDARAKAVSQTAAHQDAQDETHVPVAPPSPLPLPAMPAKDAAEFARRVTRLVHTSQLESASRMQRVTGAHVFGWTDLRMRTGATIHFAIKKTFPHQSAQDIALRTWDVMADITQLRQLLPRDVQCELRAVQRVGDNAIIFDRISTDRKFERLKFTALRTTYMLVRAVDDHGRCCVGMKTIDLPVFRAALADHEAWCDIFYYFHYEDVVVGLHDEKAVDVVFGGALSYLTESIALTWLAELVFLAVRWEAKVVAPVLLRN